MAIERRIALILCLCGIALLAYAWLGHPNYGYFGVMRFAVAACAAYSAWVLFRISVFLIPVCIALVSVGGLELVGKMHRDQWVPWNVVGIACFALAGFASFFKFQRDGQ